MKNTLLLTVILFIAGVCNSQILISDIYNELKNNKDLNYNGIKEGCLAINKSSIKQSYRSNCEKPLDLTINSMILKGKQIELALTMHYYGDTKLIGFIEIKDNLLILSYGESMTSEQQVDKYKLK
jgi:hypothetical protein